MDESANAWLRSLLHSSKNARADDTFAAGMDLKCSPEAFSVSRQTPESIYESTVNLSFGGRTHQIRAQLAAIGAPVIGDVMYGAIAGATVGDNGVADEELIRRIDSCAQIDGPIGLHAYSLTWEGRIFQAAPPWAE